MNNPDGVVPLSISTAVARMRSQVGRGMPYRLGSGGYIAGSYGTSRDVPWTSDPHGVLGSDCAGAVCYAFALSRHRPGFNHVRRGFWDILDVVDDLNTNSMIGDARSTQELFVEVPYGDPLRPGDLLAYPTIRLQNGEDWVRNADGHAIEWIGHVQMVEWGNVGVAGGPYTSVKVMQCHGGQTRVPAIVRSDASAMDQHDHTWPKPEHRTAVLRLHPRFAP